MWWTRIGDVEVTRVEEMLTPGFDPAFLFPDFDPASATTRSRCSRGAAFRDAASGKTMSSMQSWLVRDGRNVIVIDTGCGNGKAREFPAFRRFHMLDLPYLDRLAEAGVRPSRSRTSSTPICTSITSAGTRCAPTAAGCRRSRTRAISWAEELANWLDPARAVRVPPRRRR